MLPEGSQSCVECGASLSQSIAIILKVLYNVASIEQLLQPIVVSL